MVLVDVDDLDLGLADVVREWIARLERLGEEHRAFVVAVVQLRPADNRKEPRRIDPIDELFLDDLDVLAEFLVDVRHAARDRPQRTQDGGVIRRILTPGGWEARTE